MTKTVDPTDMQTRLDHSRSIEDAERFQAIDTLKELGLLIPVTDLETYHGRAGDSSEGTWQVDPSFTNGSNDSGNSNVNERPTLYTGDQETARDIADKRVGFSQANKQRRAEIHEIVHADPDATIIDLGFDSSKLDDHNKARYAEALKALLIPVTEGSPVGFEHKDALGPYVQASKRLQKNFLTVSDVATIVAESGVDQALADQLAGGYNARFLAHIHPSYLVHKLLNSRHDIVTGALDDGGKMQELPINLEYVERYLRLAHIVGVKQTLNSATLARKITSVSFFDLERTKTAESLASEREATWKRLGGAATLLKEIAKAEAKPRDLLHALLQDVHAKPEKLIQAARLVEGYDQIFDADAGNWEGFTLAEHTETVLRNFDENFADKIPVEFLAPMRLAIIAHDLGKPAANANGQKHLQKEYNASQANDFLAKAGVDDRLKGIILAVIGNGSSLAYKVDIGGEGETAKAQLYEWARNTLSKFSPKGEHIDDQIAGFVDMCRMLQICDGGAYTSMAVTSRGNSRVRFRNPPSFNRSFAPPVGLGRRSIRLRNGRATHAPYDLTPKAAEREPMEKAS